MNTMEMKVADLKPHPKNEEIYGYGEDVSDLVEKIKKSGRVHTMTVNSDGVVLAGHRRLKACIELGIETVNAEIVDFDTPEEEIEFIVLDNHQREKTVEQKAKEARVLKEVESKLAERRLSIFGATGGRGNKKGVPDSAQGLKEEKKGKARDIVAKNVGLRSGHEVDRAITAVNKIDELKKTGRVEDAELIRGVLNNRSVSAAEELARNIDIVEIPEKEKPLIQSGKKSSYSYVEQAKQKQKPKEETKTCKTCGKTYSIHMFYKGRNECKNCCSVKDSKRRSGVIKDLFGNPLPYDKELVNSQAVKDAIAHLKRDPSKDTNEIDYDMEFKIFKKTLDDYYCVNKKFIDGEIFKDMPLEIKNKFYEEINNLSKYTQLLQMNLEK
jgi:ParB family chromosome partitioning protein